MEVIKNHFMDKLYVQYGCGLSNPAQWKNFDISPTLRLQKIPIIGVVLKSKLKPVFPSNVLYGDIISGLPIKQDSCDGLYCSHTLEHLALKDFRIALKNTYGLLKKGGIFRCVVPDLEYHAREYVSELNGFSRTANVRFMQSTLLGVEIRPRGIKSIVTSFLGNSHHLWMWDYLSMEKELKDVGFLNIRRCQFNDCEDPMFKYVEEASRFSNALAIECKK